MTTEHNVGHQLAEPGNMTVAMTALANSYGAAASLNTNRFNQLGADSASMWAIAMTTPTQNAAMAYRTATESGSGRTRAETNLPAGTGAGAGGGT